MLHSICQQTWKTQQWPQDWKRSTLITIPKKGSTKECSNHQTIALIYHASKVMLKILQARLQPLHEPGTFRCSNTGFRKRQEEPEIKLSTFTGSEKAREFQKYIYLCFIDYAKAFDCVDHKLCKPLKEMEISNHLCFLINLYCLNYHTIALISHASKVMLKILQARLQQYVKTMKFQMFKLVLEKAEEPEIKLPTSAGSWKKQESSRKTSISASLTMPKPLTVWITINRKIQEMGIPDT